LALEHRRVRDLGIDLVAMSVNDVLTVGAEPLFFLDYVACHRLDPDQVAEIVEGVSRGCSFARCALLGGETAEMPDLYRPEQFDLAGFCVGVVERRRIIDGRNVEPGDAVLGLASSGVHSNGYTLVRKLLDRLPKKTGRNVELRQGCSASPADGEGGELPVDLGEPLMDALLRPTRIYVASVVDLLKRYRRKRVVRAMAHITGGGLPGNLPRVLPEDCDVEIRRKSWPVPPVFQLLQGLGVDEDEMVRVFNMGIGFVLIVRPAFARSVAAQLEKMGETVYRIGTVRQGSGKLVWR
jgi:phosphoribosylformylglycinamidine cyclo-ligase